MNIPAEKIAKLRAILGGESRGVSRGGVQGGAQVGSKGGGKKILIVSHYNPDGDALGSSLAWGRMLERAGHSVKIAVPNKFPSFLDWMPGVERVFVYSEHHGEIRKIASEAEVVCCLDFNNISRTEEGLKEVVESNTSARRVLIDHHLEPQSDWFDVEFSYPESSSASYIVYSLIEQMESVEAIDRDMGTNLYVGMMTDTGNFSYGNLTPELFRAMSVLVEKGIDIPAIHQKIYNSYTEGRVRLLGYAIGPKMKLIEKKQVAHISLTEAELRRFWFRQGDSEGFVNYPLSIKSVKMSAMFLQNQRFIRVSLRSRGDVDVNLFARRYFDGGGHKNAAGGKSTDSMEATIKHFERSVAEFFREQKLNDGGDKNSGAE